MLIRRAIRKQLLSAQIPSLAVESHVEGSLTVSVKASHLTFEALIEKVKEVCTANGCAEVSILSARNGSVNAVKFTTDLLPAANNGRQHTQAHRDRLEEELVAARLAASLAALRADSAAVAAMPEATTDEQAEASTATATASVAVAEPEIEATPEPELAAQPVRRQRGGRRH